MSLEVLALFMQVDKVSILDHTIEYLKELERRVEELDSGREVSEPEVRTRKPPKDSAERTSESCGHNKKPSINKRKVRDIDEIKDPYNTAVSIIEKEVLIEIRCPWRDCLLLKIMDAISHLHLDSHSVQSTNSDGILSLTVKSKVNLSIQPTHFCF